VTFERSNYHVLNRYRRFSTLINVKPRDNYRRFFVWWWFVVGGSLVGFLLLPWQQTVTGAGSVIAYSPNERPQVISAPVDGRVDRWLVPEGAHVKQGDVIVELIDNDPEIVPRIKLERDAVVKRVEAAKSALETADKNVNRQETLIKKGLSAPLGLEQARLNYNRYLVEEANAIAELARMDVKLARQLSQSVTAPISGTILKVEAGQGGQLVKQGDNLAILVPETSSRTVELWVRGNDMPLLSKGRQVRLQFEGWPAIQFSGWPSVAVGTFGGEIGFIDAADDGNGGFRVLIFPTDKEPWPDSRYLRQGVRVKGWVLLEQVFLGFELWRRFNGFPPSLQKPHMADKDAPIKGNLK
jgi:multidrug efflux pump subunit AcrA (membrane-fusion protein)